MKHRSLHTGRALSLVVGIAIALFGLWLTITILSNGLSWAFGHWWQLVALVVVGAVIYGLYSGRIRLPEKVKVGLPALAPGQLGSSGQGMSRRATRPGILSTIGGLLRWLLTPVRWIFRKIRWIIRIAAVIVIFAGGTIFGLGLSGVSEFSIGDLLNINIPLIGQAVKAGQVVSLDGEPHVAIAPVPDGVEELVVEELGGIEVLGKQVGGSPWILGGYGGNAAPPAKDSGSGPTVIPTPEVSGGDKDVVIVAKPEGDGTIRRFWSGAKEAVGDGWDWLSSKR